MADREKVINGLTEISEYVRAKDTAGLFDSWRRTADDAIALLQEPEPVPVEVYEIDEWHCRYVACPVCGIAWMSFRDKTHYCPNCGRRVVWEVDADWRA